MSFLGQEGYEVPLSHHYFTFPETSHIGRKMIKNIFVVIVLFLSFVVYMQNTYADDDDACWYCGYPEDDTAAVHANLKEYAYTCWWHNAVAFSDYTFISPRAGACSVAETEIVWIPCPFYLFTVAPESVIPKRVEDPEILTQTWADIRLQNPRLSAEEISQPTCSHFSCVDGRVGAGCETY